MIKYSLKIAVLLSLPLLTSCSTGSQGSREEISLKADRKFLDQYRSEIPEEVKAENDFLALILKDMAEVKSKPQEVRDRYYKEVRRKRDSYNKQHRQIREKFNKDEKKKRDEFLSDLKKERNEFVKSKPSSSESSEFFKEQNTKRSSFFQDQSDRRKDFESEMDQARRDFNDDMNLKQKQFDDSYREYMKNYQEKEKQKKLEAANPAPMVPRIPVAPSVQAPKTLPPATYPGQDKDLAEFDNLPSGPRDSLGN